MAGNISIIMFVLNHWSLYPVKYGHHITHQPLVCVKFNTHLIFLRSFDQSSSFIIPVCSLQSLSLFWHTGRVYFLIFMFNIHSIYPTWDKRLALLYSCKFKIVFLCKGCPIQRSSQKVNWYQYEIEWPWFIFNIHRVS